MRLGVFTDSYRPYVSGVVQSIDTFSYELQRRGHFLEVFAPRYPNCRDAVDSGVYRFPSFNTPFYPEFYIGMPFFWAAQNFAKSLRLDLIHVHSPFSLGHVGAYIARSLRVPLVFTYHTLYDQYVHYFPFARPLAQKAMVHLAKEFCNRCSLVVTPNRVIEKLLRSYGVNAPIICIPTGIDARLFESGDRHFLRSKFDIAPEQKILLFVGRIGQEKNLDSLFRIFSRVLQGGQDATLVLVGSGPAEEELGQLAMQMGVASRIVFTGRLSQEDVAGACCSADIFVFPSVTETQGLVLTEAMAAGLPVVAMAAFGSVATVDDGVTGYLCKTDDEFAEHVIELLQDQALCQQMGNAAVAKAQNLTAEKMAIRLERAYLALIANDRDALEQVIQESF